MTFMKAAIVGKDGEQFLSDTPDEKTLKAATDTPAVPGNVHPAIAIPAEVKTVKTSIAREPSVVAPAGISEEDLAAKPALDKQPKPVTGVVPPKSQVKPALSPKAPAAKPTALEPNPNSKLPKSQGSARADSR
jgi:hypothetical protein